MLLVTGATGNVGRELARETRRRWRTVPCPGSRSRQGRRAARRSGARPRRPRPPRHAGARARGADGLFLLTPGIGTDHVRHAVAAAQAAGVRHIVHLSSSNVLGDPMPAMGRWHHEREQVIRVSGIPATFLRPGGFMTNAFDWLPTIREDGYVLNPAGLGRYAPIDPADIAAVAAVALTGDGHQGREYVLTGDETFTVAEQVAILSAATGLDLEVREPATPRRGRPRPLSQRGAAGARRRHPRGIRPAARRRSRLPQRHCPEAARPRAPHLRRLVRTQCRRLPPACRRLSPQVRRETGRPANSRFGDTSSSRNARPIGSPRSRRSRPAGNAAS